MGMSCFTESQLAVREAVKKLLDREFSEVNYLAWFENVHIHECLSRLGVLDGEGSSTDLSS